MDSSDGKARASVAGVGRAGFIRDPSGLLMSIIRTLASSDDDRQRDQEKERLEEAFTENDEKLDEMVAINYEELAKTIKQFGKIGERISESRSRIKHVKESLLQCKSLLHCRQDELRNLWKEGVKYKRVLQLLDDIEEVKAAPENIDQFMKQKYYLHATQLILKILRLLTHDLIKVEALNDIRNELLSRRVTMHEGFITELHKQLYFNSVKASDRDSEVKYDLNDVEKLEDVTKDPEKDPFRLMAILVLSLGLLGKIPDAIEATKVKMDRHINMIVTHTTVEITDLFYKQGDEGDNPERLLQLLEKLFEKFRCIASAHEHILHLISQSASKNSDGSMDVQLYDMEEVWSKIQSVLQAILQEYLDFDNASANSQLANTGFNDVQSGSFASHFSRKRATRPRVAKLFRFEASSHAISMNTYLREQRAEQRINAGTKDASTQELVDHNITAQKVCKPNSRNITLIFGPLNNFIKEIESEMHYSGGRKCLLNDFITDYIQNVFIRQIQYEMKKSFDASSKVTDPLKALMDTSSNKKLNSSCNSLLQSAVVVDQCMWDLHSLMTNLGGYHDQFLAMACSLLHEYKETLIQSYRGVVQPQSEDQRIISASWVREADSNKFLRNLENWAIVQRPVQKTNTHNKYSHQLLKDFYKEGQYFVSRVGDEPIPTGGFVEDVTDLTAIANLHESLQWFVKRLNLLLTEINPTAPQDTMLMLNQLCRDYNSMSEVCLLCLHIEVRIHCFYYLIPMCKKSNFDIRTIDNMERDAQVIKLASVISSMDEVFRSALQPHKQSYVFEGLGHMISAILIHGSRFINRITHSGIKRMCRNIFALQQVITHATMSRESHLDSARLYYEMLYHSVDDLQSIVVEQGVQFEEDDYVQAVELLHRSRPGSGSESTRLARIQRLREIIREQVHKSEQAAKLQLEEEDN
ncbi:exocyst complex component 4-like [Styela clava]